MRKLTRSSSSVSVPGPPFPVRTPRPFTFTGTRLSNGVGPALMTHERPLPCCPVFRDRPLNLLSAAARDKPLDPAPPSDQLRWHNSSLDESEETIHHPCRTKNKADGQRTSDE
jgi:hypothetical protein